MINTLITESYTLPHIAPIECIINGGMRTITFSNNLRQYRQHIPKIIHCLYILGIKTQLKKIHFSVQTTHPKLESPYYLPALILAAYTKSLRRPSTAELLLYGDIDHETGWYTQSVELKSLLSLIPLPKEYSLIQSALLNNTPLPLERYKSENEKTSHTKLQKLYYVTDLTVQNNSQNNNIATTNAITLWANNFTDIHPTAIANDALFYVVPNTFAALLKIPIELHHFIKLRIHIPNEMSQSEIFLLSKILESYPNVAVFLQQKIRQLSFITNNKQIKLNQFILQLPWDEIYLQSKSTTKQITSTQLQKILTL